MSAETLTVRAKREGNASGCLQARLRGRIDTLLSRRGEYKVVLIGSADDLEALTAVARLQSMESVTLTMESET